MLRIHKLSKTYANGVRALNERRAGMVAHWQAEKLAIATMRDHTAYRRAYAVGLGLSAVLLIAATWAAATRHWLA